LGDGADRFRRGVLRRGVVVGGSAVALVALAAGWLGLPLSAASASPLLYLSEPFSGNQVQIPSDWVRPALPTGTTGTNVACLTASGSTAQTPIPGCSASPTDLPGNGTLRLTAATGNVDGGVSYATAVPSSQGLDVTFDTYQYGGNGADGILLYLAGTNPLQPAPPASLGPPGGHLGYSGGTAAPTGPGIANGYLGVGLDVYGNYSNNAFDGSGCTDPAWVGKGARVTNQVTVRGPGSGTQGYCPLASSAGAGGLQGKLDGGATGTRSTSLVPTEIAINPTAASVSARGIPNVPAYSYAVAVSPLGGPTQYVIGSLPNASAYEPSSWLEPSTGIPYQLAFGFAASTGGSNDVHEVRNVQIQPLFTNPARAVLQITDSAAGHLVAGTPVTYGITPSISALGGSENQPMYFTDTFPTGVVPGAGSGTNWSCSTAGQTVTCNYTGSYPIAAGTTLPSITVPAAVANGATGTLDDVGQLVSDDAQIVSTTDPGTVGVALVTPVLGVSLADSAGGAYVQGGIVTYTATATVSSGGGAEAAAPRLVDVFPTGVTPGVASGTNWSCATVAQTVTCNYTGSLPIAAGTTLPTASLPVTVGSSASGGISDTVTLSSTDAAPSTVSASVSGSILSIPQYSLTLTDSRSGNFLLGAAVTYTATPTLVAGSGTESAAPTYSQTLATGVTPTAVSGTNWTCAKSGQSVNCTYSGAFPITPGTQLQPITISANVSAGATGNVSSTGTVQSSDGLSATAVDSANAGSPPPPSLSVTASAPSQTYAGRSYTLTVGPAITSGSAPANNDPVVKSILPAGETFTAVPTPAGYTCALSATTVVNDTLTCTSTAATPIAAGSLGTIGATVAVAPATAPGSLSATTTLTDPADGATPASNGTTITCVATPVPVVTTSGPASSAAGSTGTFVITPSLSGAGGPAYVDPVVTVTAPSGGTFSADPTPVGWSCVLSGANTVATCSSTAATPIASGTALGAISASVTFSSTPGSQTTSATLSDTPDGATPVTNSATTTTTAIPQLAVTVSSPAHAVAGSIGTVVVTPSLSGAGGPAYVDPVVTVTAPSGGTFSADPTPVGWSCVLSGANTVATCSSTAATPIASGTALGAISASVTFSSTPGSQTTSATLSDTPDLAIPVTSSATTTTTTPTPPDPPTRFGYRLTAGDGGVFAFGQDSFLGSLVSRNVTPTAPISGMAATTDGNGYWLVGVDGNIYTFGTAQNYGSLYAAHVPLNRPIVGMAATPDGKGYWLVASDGGVFAVGDAGFYGNTYTIGIENQLDKPIVGMVGDSTGHGYWLVASDGGVFTFGDAGFYGNTYTIGIENQLDKPMVGMAAMPDGHGYWLVAADGGVFAFGDAPFEGNTYTTGIENQLDKPMVGMAAMPDGRGYWLVAADGGVFAYGDAPFEGNTYTIGIENLLNAPMVALTEAP